MKGRILNRTTGKIENFSSGNRFKITKNVIKILNQKFAENGNHQKKSENHFGYFSVTFVKQH